MRSDREHPLFAWFYERLSSLPDRFGSDQMRSRLVSGVTGRVLEVGVGNGLTLRHYDPAAQVVAIEPDPNMLRHAIPRAKAANARVSLIAADGEQLPFKPASFDAVVVCLVLCSIPDASAALAELHRVIKPGGRLHFVEHVRAEGSRAAAFQDWIDPYWSHAFGGCHPTRDTAGTLRKAGFKIEDVQAGWNGIFIRGFAVAA